MILLHIIIIIIVTTTTIIFTIKFIAKSLRPFLISQDGLNLFIFVLVVVVYVALTIRNEMQIAECGRSLSILAAILLLSL
jgi:hypothetical protein